MHNECGIEASDREGCGYNHRRLNEDQCKARGCCYDENASADVIHCFIAKRMLTAECSVPYEEKDDCGYYGISEGECILRGCCYKPSARPNDAICFHKARGQVRLMSYGGESEREGRVEINHNDEWGTVCDDAFDDTDATVVCKQLGYDYGVARCCAEYGSGSGTIWMDQVGCTGSEEYLEDCSQNGWGVHDCSHSEDASVICYNEGEPAPTESPYYPYYYSYYSQNGSGDYRFKGKGGKSRRNLHMKKGAFKKNNGIKKSLKSEKARSAKKAMPLLQGIQNLLKKKAKQ